MHQREPTLDELLNEPIIRQVMIADGHEPDDIRLLMRKVGGGLDRRASGQAKLAAGIMQSRGISGGAGGCCGAGA
ncbi:hypothetical protein [Mesorhizobium sp. L-8-3]|uniref:hypothetical protein n=1 Tax=Mesorhizobium sp. L-8-3 TaxID=2744522 RepID=UPI0019283723|nr:hypothetical protein [Mesorhizobium sp. L-8-3]BCH22540.1 hypothetical protein MesoLjLb_23250 [Mesorhizobium sp. L-8-3]